MVASVVTEEPLGIDEVMNILDEASQVRAYTRELEQKSLELTRATAELREANARLRERLTKEIGKRGGKVYFPELEYCSDNGAMIAFACAMRVKAGKAASSESGAFAIRPRWPLAEISG